MSLRAVLLAMAGPKGDLAGNLAELSAAEWDGASLVVPGSICAVFGIAERLADGSPAPRLPRLMVRWSRAVAGRLAVVARLRAGRRPSATPPASACRC